MKKDMDISTQVDAPGVMSRSSGSYFSGLRSWLVVLAVVFAGVMGHVWVRTQVVRMSYDIEQTRKQVGELESELMQLRLKRSRKLSGANLKRVANVLDQRGVKLIVPSSDQVIVIRD